MKSKHFALCVLAALTAAGASRGDEPSHGVFLLASAGRHSSAGRPEAPAEPAYGGEAYKDIWDKITEKPLDHLPDNKVALDDRKGTHLLNPQIVDDAKRTINDKRAILPYFKKRVHPMGICFAGTWNITEETPYTGYFKKGASGLVIARASSANGNTKKGEYRPLGIAGRVFPTTNPDDKTPLQSANFFAIDSLTGTKTPHFTDGVYKNQPDLPFHLDDAANYLGAQLVGKYFGRADGNPTIRQIYEIAELGVAADGAAKSPKRMQLRFAPDQTVDRIDFRNELRLENHGGKLLIDIYTSDNTDSSDMKKIGQVEFTKDSISEGCDHNFHVHHPKWKEKYE
jgi:hypothetical protein